MFLRVKQHAALINQIKYGVKYYLIDCVFPAKITIKIIGIGDVHLYRY